MAHGVQVAFDCADPKTLAEFYAAVLHYKMQDPPAGSGSWEEWLTSRGVPREEWNDVSAIVDPTGKGPRVFFQRMDTPKPGKNRLHVDVNASGGLKVPLAERRKQVDVEVARILGLGAAKQREFEEDEEYWVVMLDPEGNEFCVQ